jgi:hypothetical protein
MNGANSRRGFLKGFGLLSAVAAGASAPYLANTSASMDVRHPVDPVLSPPVDQALAPLGLVNLTLTADNTPPPPPPPATYGNGMYLVSNGSGSSSYQTVLSLGTESTADTTKNNVKMSVGKDNRLWLEVDGKWRRVALEG